MARCPRVPWTRGHFFWDPIFGYLGILTAASTTWRVCRRGKQLATRSCAPAEARGKGYNGVTNPELLSVALRRDYSAKKNAHNARRAEKQKQKEIKL